MEDTGLTRHEILVVRWRCYSHAVFSVSHEKTRSRTERNTTIGHKKITEITQDHI